VVEARLAQQRVRGVGKPHGVVTAGAYRACQCREAACAQSNETCLPAGDALNSTLMEAAGERVFIKGRAW
jgi:hypothetical protein